MEIRKNDSIRILLGLGIFLVTLAIDPPIEGLSLGGWRTMGLAGTMVVWWIEECVPIPVTSFLPLAFAPLLEIGSFKSIAIEKVNLHQRIARSVIGIAGSNPRWQIGRLILVTSLLSMWISNTATTVIMLPIALSIAHAVGGGALDVRSSRFASTLLLGVAYGAAI